ncbi:hypothetical protein M011DRAFT_456429 [Sporormia fimetaria CBS 119925]|uniref:Nucleolar protein 12 n=1 Tax=Sporormia fimetaria CBS 119925 TaxID=1340428 RepID=A0A6A6VIW6_9PLEO|nr:hypothetical protein M011DRAFT_456429 [Sporormia fimetaria CBS 119925]
MSFRSRNAPPPSKKRKISTTAPAEITFDFAAREEYLTGFHKRKLARIKHAQEEAAKKEKEERLRMRAELRKQRKEDLEKHVAEVNALLRKANGDPSEAEDGSDSNDEDSEFEGFDEPVPEEINREDEYIDEDKYTTVTIESVGISKDGFESTKTGDGETEGGDDEKKEKRVWTKEKPKTIRPKKKKQKFRYESKAERKATRIKQGAKKKAQAAARKAK